ncbi:E3 ubiquitin-protein ligase rnf8-like isoform X1 [Planococcus citri]|uniref:E3 ubiquitin-protein ligase rnf8-like isoform X1 n=2 Tax=Planococcus citri TaxID=170843 RepID=UPI0031F81442
MDSVRSEFDTNDEATLNVESTTNSLNVESHIELKTLSQLRTQYRKLLRVHPYAVDVKMVKELLSEVSEKDKKNLELIQETTSLRNTIKSYEEQINWQEDHIKMLEDQIKQKDDRITALEKQLTDAKADGEKKLEELKETIKTLQDQIKTQDERIASLTNDAPKEAAADTSTNSDSSQGEIIKSQEDKILLLQAELTDLNYRVKKQDMQIQFLEVDLKYKDTAESMYSENRQRQEIKIQFLEIELNYRKNNEDELKQDKKRLESKIYELTKTAETLKCENLSLNNILNRDGCSSSEDFCCETVKQVKLSFIDLIETEFECIICNGMFIEATLTACNHMFCNHCLQQWRKKSPNCPICRSLIKFEIKTTIIDNYIINTAKLISEKMYSDRKKALEERIQAKNIAKYKRLCV